MDTTLGWRIACNHCEFFEEIMFVTAQFQLGSRRQEHEQQCHHTVTMYAGRLTSKHEIDWVPSQFKEYHD